MRGIAWVVLTQGRRPSELNDAVRSLLEVGGASLVVVWCNGCDPADVGATLPGDPRIVVRGGSIELGVPGGRDAAVRSLADLHPIIGFLDDDATLVSRCTGEYLPLVFDNPAVGAVTFRIVDESDGTSRRHNPRVGYRGLDRAGPVTTFLGGGSALRLSAYAEAGGYWPDLLYGHEELDLSWRLAAQGWEVHYEPQVVVRHPRTEIARHVDGWRRTGRNRVLIARRNLPWIVAIVHTTVWLVVGTWRAPAGCRGGYVAGWTAGWRRSGVPRKPMSWRTVIGLSRLGRPPFI